jgi:hypothetical protein
MKNFKLFAAWFNLSTISFGNFDKSISCLPPSTRLAKSLKSAVILRSRSQSDVNNSVNAPP